MASYKTPGVYVEEIPSLPASVAQVATAIPAFIGYTETAASTHTPVRITSMAEFRQNFGGPPVAVTLDASGGLSTPTSYTYKLYFSLQMFYANGGGACWITSCGSYSDPVAKADMDDSLVEVAKEDEPTLLLMPDASSLADIDEYYTLMKSMLTQCAALQDRFTLMDPYKETATMVADFGTKIGNQNLSYGACYYPNLVSTLPFPDEAVKFAAGVPAPRGGKTLAECVAIAAGTDAAATTMAGVLNPIMHTVRDTLADEKLSTLASTAVAGVYARVDRQRGVWKAPANESLVAVEEPVTLVTHDAQQTLNAPTNGKAFNVIRRFKGKGNLIWGARTLDANSLEWRYVPVRRLFIMVEESIAKATEPLVFEPNDANTWTRVRAMIENFLTGLWRDGALQGANPKDAFFVNAGLGSTMTAQDILDGYLNIEVGIAAVRPAEFIILNFSHKLQES